MAGYSSWGHKESDTTEQLTLSLHTSFLWLFFGYTQGCRGAYIQPLFANNLFLLDLPLLWFLNMASFPAGF